MNSFFASCEIAENPSLKGKKIAVGHVGNDRKGLIVAASYEAKPFGIKAPMTIYEAKIKCPDLIVVDAHMELYQEYSRKFFDYFLSITPLVEPGSIDEAYLDVTDVCEASKILDLAKTIQNEILVKFNLPCSVGIAPNKFLAKMASDMKKPLGITVLRKREIDKLLWPLPIASMFGVGNKSLDSFKALGIKTIGDLANYKDLKLLKEVLGKNSAESLYYHANGGGSTSVDISRFTDVSSLSHSHTLDHDEYDQSKMLLMIKILTNTLQNRLETDNLKAHTFTLQIKYNTFKLVSRSKTFNDPMNDSKQMYNVMKDLFEDLYDNETGVRLLGVGASKLVEKKEEIKQLSIFDDLDSFEKEHKINTILESINKSIGYTVIRRGMKIDKKADFIGKYTKR